MLPQHHHIPRRVGHVTLALVAGVASIPLLTTTHVAATQSPSVATDSTALESEIHSILELALAHGAIPWNNTGTDAPPTGVNAAVRIPGRDDVVVASGTDVDGTPFDPTGPYAAGLQDILVQTVAWQLADEGDLDLDATIDTWLPDVPNADRVTIGMLADLTTGWNHVDKTTPIVADLSRRWTLAEVMEGVVGIEPVREPGTSIGTEAADHSTTALAYVLEQVTGDSVAELIQARIITPLGLDETFILDGVNHPVGFQHGVFANDGQVVDTSMFPNVSYYTYFGAAKALVSTSTELLDLLEALVAGDLFTTDRIPDTDRFLDERQLGSVYGLGAPLNGYCPCESAGEGRLDVAAVGRRGQSLGSTVAMIRFDDGISVVLHFNSDATDDADTWWPYVVAIHDAAATS